MASSDAEPSDLNSARGQGEPPTHRYIHHTNANDIAVISTRLIPKPPVGPQGPKTLRRYPPREAIVPGYM